MILTLALAFMFTASAQKASVHEIEYESFTSVNASFSISALILLRTTFLSCSHCLSDTQSLLMNGSCGVTEGKA